MQAVGEIEFRTHFVREPGALRQHPALVLNADYRPLSYYPLSLWPWQEAIKAVWLDRVEIVAEYDEVVRSPSTEIRIPSVVVLPRLHQAAEARRHSTRFNLFSARRVFLPVLRGEGRSDLRPRRATRPRRRDQLGKRRGGLLRNAISGRPPPPRARAYRQSGLSLRKPPRQPGAEELRNMGRRSFPPNHLHESWLDLPLLGCPNWRPERQAARWISRIFGKMKAGW